MARFENDCWRRSNDFIIDDLPAEFWPNNSVICLSGTSVGAVNARKLLSFMPDRTDVLTVISPQMCDYGIPELEVYGDEVWTR